MSTVEKLIASRGIVQSKLSQIKQELEKKMIEPCTFVPKINPEKKKKNSTAGLESDVQNVQ